MFHGKNPHFHCQTAILPQHFRPFPVNSFAFPSASSPGPSDAAAAAHVAKLRQLNVPVTVVWSNGGWIELDR